MPIRRRRARPPARPDDALGHALAMLHAGLDATSEGIVLFDPTGRVVTFNEQLLDIWQMPRALAESGDGGRVLGHLRQQLHETTPLDRALAEIAADPSAYTSHRLDLADGRHVEATSSSREISGSPHRVWVFRENTLDVHGELALRGVVGQEREVIDRARRLREMEAAFLTAVSHEIRTPLSSIVGFASTLRESGESIAAPLRRDMVERIERNARRLEHLISDLIDVDRLQRGTLEAHRAPTDVAGLIRRVVEENPNIPVERVAISAGDVTALVDASLVERMVDNLLNNALKHSPPGGKVWISASIDDHGLNLVVEDEGPGVPEPYRQSIFEPFRQAPGVSEAAPGMGLGLALVAGVAKLHGGGVWVEDRDGGGASFWVVLPDEPVTGRPGPSPA